MSPARVCRHGALPRACGICARARAQERRPYSDTAAYRQMLHAVLEHYGSTCHYADVDPLCIGPIDLEPGAADPLELAHVIAHADGGRFDLGNLRPAHRSCNRRAGRGRTPGGTR